MEIILRNGMTTKDGTISHGTMHPGDIGNMLADFLDFYSHDWFQRQIEEYAGLFDSLGDREAEFWASEDGEHFTEAAWEHMEYLAPEGYSFGAHPGDGSDYGYWPDDDDDDDTEGDE